MLFLKLTISLRVWQIFWRKVDIFVSKNIHAIWLIRSPSGSTHFCFFVGSNENPRVRPRTRWHEYISDLVWSDRCVDPVELSDVAETVRYFGPLWGCCLRDALQVKSGCQKRVIDVCYLLLLTWLRAVEIHSSQVVNWAIKKENFE